jgi:hypothetical protein
LAVFLWLKSRRECEQRFSKNGEDYVMRLVTKRTGDFPLFEVLNRVRPTISGPEWNAYSSADTQTVDRAKVAYFAISVFWRASVHIWGQEVWRNVAH